MFDGRRGVVAIVLAIPALLYPCRASIAQIDPGLYRIVIADESDVHVRHTQRADVLGQVSVPTRSASAVSYTEQWEVPPALLASSRVLEIRPVRAGDRVEADVATAREVVEAVANEHDLDPTPGGGSGLLAALEAITPGIGERGASYVREIWQGPASAGELRLVGFILGTQADGGTWEHWLLSKDYVNPSPYIEVRTQLRPRLHEATLAVGEIVADIAPSIQVRRYIDVELRSGAALHEPAPEDVNPGMNCTYEARLEGGNGLVVLGLGLAALAVRRRRIRGRPS